jgi:beta-N-acetylhexosaminidase
MPGGWGRAMSRRRVLAGAGQLAALGALAACGASRDERSPAAREASPLPSVGASPTPLPPLEVMAGQILMLGFRGTGLVAGNPILGDLRDRHLGGVVLFSYDVASATPIRNIESPAQVAALTAALQAEARGRLFIAADQEGGLIARLSPRYGFPATKSAAELGALNDPAATRVAAAAMAGTLRTAGVNFNLAPVVDLNTNPANPVIGDLDRSFSADPAVVRAQAAAFVEGHRSMGILTSLKHFPGHGSSRDDSHLGFVDVTGTWAPVELEPYRALIPDGLADTVMAAHVFNAKLDAQHPASLSEATIGGILRREMGFDGVVVSDDMQMGAITEHYSFDEAIRLALLAGNDLLLFANNIPAGFDPGLGERAHTTILRLVERGDVPRSRVEEAYQRVEGLRGRLG